MKLKIIHTPRKNDFLIHGELLKIEILHTSFEVHYQPYLSDESVISLDLYVNVYPIRFLSQFFQENGKEQTSYYIKRAEPLMQP